MIFVLLPKKEAYPYKVVKSTLDDLCATQCLVVENTPGLASGKDLSRGAGHICNILAKVNQKRVRLLSVYFLFFLSSPSLFNHVR